MSFYLAFEVNCNKSRHNNKQKDKQIILNINITKYDLNVKFHSMIRYLIVKKYCVSKEYQFDKCNESE